jgi:hypothetical protein
MILFSSLSHAASRCADQVETEEVDGLTPPSIEQLPLTVLLEEAQRETAQFRRQMPTQSRFALEVFRRALVLRDEAAWVGLYGLYQNVVATWILHRMHPSRVENLEALVNQTFAKFAQAIDARNFRSFATTAALLAYLKACASSVAADEGRRTQSRATEESLDRLAQPLPGVDPAEVVCDRIAAHDLWQVIISVARDDAERLILEQNIQRGIAPRDLALAYPQWFPTAKAVYDTKRRLLERLRRDPRIRACATQPIRRMGKTSVGKQSRRSKERDDADASVFPG